MTKTEYKLVVKGTEYKFDTYTELYQYFDYEVDPNDFDDMKIYMNGYYLGKEPTKVWKQYAGYIQEWKEMPTRRRTK